MQNIITYLKERKFITALILILLIAGLVLTIVVAQQRQQLRQRASSLSASCSWEKVENATYYNYEISNNAGTPPTKGSTYDTQIAFDAVSGVEYTCKVIVANICGGATSLSGETSSDPASYTCASAAQPLAQTAPAATATPIPFDQQKCLTDCTDRSPTEGSEFDINACYAGCGAPSETSIAAPQASCTETATSCTDISGKVWNDFCSLNKTVSNTYKCAADKKTCEITGNICSTGQTCAPVPGMSGKTYCAVSSGQTPPVPPTNPRTITSCDSNIYDSSAKKDLPISESTCKENECAERTEQTNGLIKTSCWPLIAGTAPAVSLTPTTATPTPAQQAAAGNTILAISLNLEGIAIGKDANGNLKGNGNPKTKTRPTTVELLNSTNRVVATKTGEPLTFDPVTGLFKGNVNLDNNIAGGNYLVKIKSDRYVKRLFPGIVNVVAGQTIAVPTLTLFAGDVNGDNALDILDYNIFISCFGAKATAVSCTAKSKFADVNDDGNVDGVDYNLFVHSLAIRKGD